MRYPSRLFVAMFLLCALTALTGFAADTGNKAVDAAWLKAMKAGDLEGVMACYAPDAVAWMPSAPEASGAKAIRAVYQGMFAANTIRDVAIVDAHYKTSGSISTAWGHYTMTLVPKAGGAPFTDKGRFTSAAELRGGRWVYVADHASSEPPPPPAAK